MPIPFAHLHAHSAFSFLDSASAVQDLVLRAAELGQPALALTDLNSVTGVVGLTRRCAKAGIKPIGGCTVRIDGGELILLADGPTGWASLCQILTAAGLRDVKRQGLSVTWEDIERHQTGLVCLSGCAQRGRVAALVRARRYKQAEEYARRCLSLFGTGNYHIEVTRTMSEGEHAVSCRLFQLADHLGVPAVATNPIRHATKMGVAAYEILCRVRLGLAPEDEHPDLPFNGEGYVKGGEAMARLFADRPDALRNAAALAERLAPPLNPAARHSPRFPLPLGESAFSMLAGLTWCGAQRRYGNAPSEAVRARLVHELETIHDMDYCHYFLVVWDICREAKRRGVRYAMRGSGVGSAVAYCLDIGQHDPIRYGVSFERFLSRGRAKPPDVDVDFRHDERDPLMDYVRSRYGDDRVANVVNYVCYKGRSLLRDFGKALGLDTGEVDRLRELLGHSRGDDLAARIAEDPQLRAIGIDLTQYADLFALCATCAGLPRHFGTHSSGIVVSGAIPLASVAPLVWTGKGVTAVAFDKDDVEAPGVGLLKIDQLALRGLTVLDTALETLAEDGVDVDYEGRDRDDPEVMAMIRAAQTMGVPQLESPAQMSLQWRLGATKFTDIIHSVALIRPGPLLGKSADRYIARRNGWEKVTFPLPELEPLLTETYGRILFQDQAIMAVRLVGDFTPDEADEFQRNLTHARDKAETQRLGLLLYERAKAKGLTGKAFEGLWRQIKAFVHYGFCHGHSLAFADHAEGAAMLLRYHPAHFLAAVLSCQPCGFWPVVSVTNEAHLRGVKVRGPCVNRSDWQRWVLDEDGAAIRCSLSYVRELARSGAAIVEERRLRGEFETLEGFCGRCHFLSREQIEWLVLAGALDGLSPNRRQTLWSLPLLHRESRRGRRGADERDAAGQGALDMPISVTMASSMADFDFGDRYWREWSALGFSPLGHPVRFVRAALEEQGVMPCASLQGAKAGQQVTLGGMIIRPHRPPTTTVVFFSLEDETGLIHAAVMPDVYQRCGSAVYGAGLSVVSGKAERRGEGVSLLVENVSLCY